MYQERLLRNPLFTMKTILTITANPAIDVSSSIDIVTPEKKLRCAPPAYEPGGGGINVSRALKILGGESTACYVSGGYSGGLLGSLLEREGITRHPIELSGETRENFVIRETSTNKQYRFGMPGPPVTGDEIDRIYDEIRSMDPVPDFIVASGSIPMNMPEDFYAVIADIANKNGAKCIIDTTGEPLRRAIDRGFFLLKPNMNELRDYYGGDIADEHEQEKAIDQILSKERVKYVVLSLGAAGVVLAGNGVMKRLRAPSVPIVSKVGAGDSTVAGLLYGLSRDRPIEESVLMGIAAGAAAVMTPGTELCRKDDAFRLYEKIKNSQP